MKDEGYQRTEAQQACDHKWRVSDLVMDIAPATYTRSCPVCKLVQHKGGMRSIDGDNEWHDAGCCMRKPTGAESGDNDFTA